MAFILSDRVKETTVTQGTGPVTLGGSTFGGFRTFSDGIGEGNTTYYCIQNDASFEIGVGTFSSGSLSRDTVIESSNSNAKISIIGVAVVFCVIPADKLFYKDDLDNVSFSGNLNISELSVDFITANSGLFFDHVKSNSFIFSDGTFQTTAALPYSSGALIDQNTDDIITNSGYFQEYIDSLDHSATEVSGYLQSYVDAQDTAVSGWADYYVDTTSGNLQNQINRLDSDLSIASGALRDTITQNSDDISATSGYFESRVDSADSYALASSGYFESRVDSADSYALASSGYFESRSDSADAGIVTVSGLLTPSGESFDFTNNILTYNNSYGGNFTADLSSLSTFDTSGVSLAYSAGTLTYTNNAGGSFDVDLSSISGDVYAMIVDGAPTTLDTLNEIAAALNDDANVANTLTTLITNTSGNLQAQIIGNDIDISTVSGLLYGHWTVSDGVNSENIYAGETVSFSGVGGTVVSYDNLTNIVSISGASDPTGVVSGIAFFGGDGVLTGNGTLTYDGQNVEVDGFITASGERVITSEDIFHIVQLTQAEYDALTPDSATFYIITDAPSVSGYFEAENVALSGYIDSQDTSISGYFQGQTDQLNTDIITVSGLTPTGIPSGMTFFADDASLTGNNTLTYDGQNIHLSGTMYASGERIITSDEIYHIKQLTQAEYDAITPDSATFYIITDASEDAAISGYFEARDTAISGYFEGATSQLSLDILTVSGLTPTGNPSGVTFFANDGSLSGNESFTFDGQNITLDGYINASGQRVITSPTVHHIVQLTQAEYDAITPDSATIYFITDSASVSGYFQSVTDSLYSDIITVSGLTPTGTPSGITFFADDGSLTGNNTFIFDGQNVTLDGYMTASGERVITSPDIHHIVQLTQAEYDALTPDSATFYIITDAPSISGYFEPRVTQNELDIITVSGLTPTGVPSGLTFFADDASLTGNNTLTYDGNNITLVGNITASGKRVITSDEINHIKQLTQAEYDALTPDPATFYIITDSEVEGPIQYPIRTVYSDTSIQLTDYSLLAGSGLNFTLPSAVGNRGTLFNIKNVGAGNVIVSGVASQTIDGAPSYSMTTQYQTLTVQSDNSNWVII